MEEGGRFLRLTSEINQMFHENSQTDVIREDGLASLSWLFVGVVRNRRVQHGQEKPSLRLVLVAHNISRDGESVVHDHLRVILGRF